MLKSFSLTIFTLFITFAGFGCSSESEDSQGMVVGLHATLVNSDDTIVSNEFEISLKDGSLAHSEISDTGRSQQAVMVSSNPKVADRSYQKKITSTMAALSSPEQEHANTIGKNCKDEPETLGTYDGYTCWMALTFSSSQAIILGKQEKLTKFLFFTPDGEYHAVGTSHGYVLSTDFFTIGSSLGIGCIKSPTGDTIEVEYLNALLGIGISQSIGPVTVGFSIFYAEGHGMQWGAQLDAGKSHSIPFLPTRLPFLPFKTPSVSFDSSGGFNYWPTRYYSCSSPVAAASQSSPFEGEGNPLQNIAAGLKTISESTDNTYQGVMEREMAKSALPTFTLLSDTQGSTPQDGIPAVNHADFMQHFFQQESSETCSDCPDTSLGSILYNFREEISAADGEANATRDITYAKFRQFQSSTPDALRLALVQQKSMNALEFSHRLHADHAAKQRGDSHYFVTEEIIEIEGHLGAPIEIIISAQEVAELIGSTAQALEGASLTVGAFPHIDDSTFLFENGVVTLYLTPKASVPLLLQSSVDLSTAVGPFDPDTTDWIIRPAMRRVVIQSGAPAQIVLSGPLTAIHGKDITLNAMVLDKDYAPVTGKYRVKFYDGTNKLLGQADVNGGIAQLKTPVTTSSPVLESAHQTELRTGDDVVVGGVTIVGKQLSRNSEVYINGTPLSSTDASITHISSTSILFTIEGSGLTKGTHALVVVNPDGSKSETKSLGIE